MPHQASIFVAILILCAPGCTADRLRRSAVDQASTMTDFQYQQVLNNIALLANDPNALPWHLTIKSGTSQVSDTGTAGLAPGIVILNNSEPFLTGTRSVVDQWGTAPVTDDTALRLIRNAYQRALGINAQLSRADINDLAHALSAQIGTNSDIAISGELVRFAIEDSISQNSAARRAAEDRKFAADLELLKAKQLNMQQSGDLSLPQALPASVADPKVRAEAAIDELRALVTNFRNSYVSTLQSEIYTDGPSEDGRYTPSNIARTGLAQETVRQVDDIQDTLSKIPRNWFHVGSKYQVPRDACYKGHCGKTWVWVGPEGRAALAEFSLTILKLASAFKDSQLVTAPSGIQFSPALSQQR
jgi:hypothetical protein